MKILYNNRETEDVHPILEGEHLDVNDNAIGHPQDLEKDLPTEGQPTEVCQKNYFVDWQPMKKNIK